MRLRLDHFVFALLGLGACAVRPEKSMSDPSAPLVARLEAGDTLTTAEVLEFHGRTSVAAGLMTAAQSRGPEFRRAALGVLIELGKPVLKADGDLPERPAPVVSDPAVVSYLAQALADADEQVRNLACATLTQQTPDRLVRPHSARIIESLSRQPAIEGAVLLMGKTGTEAARAAILDKPGWRESSAEDTQAALARLGDAAAEAEAILEYERAARPSEKARQALRLGYIASRRAVVALARDLRTPEAYVWSMRSRRSMRIHIISGLSQAYPEEPLLWRPFFRPCSDAYYEAIEQWATRTLAVTWERPRPEFLYQEDAPGAGKVAK